MRLLVWIFVLWIHEKERMLLNDALNDNVYIIFLSLMTKITIPLIAAGSPDCHDANSMHATRWLVAISESAGTIQL